MLRGSINRVLSFSSNANNTATIPPSKNLKRGSIDLKRGSIVKVRRTSQLSNKLPIQTRQSTSSNSSNERNSIKITISPQRIESVCEYVKFFCPQDNHHLLQVKEIEKLFFKPRFTKDSSFTSPEFIQQAKILHTMNHFVKLLKVTQMNANEWFDFVLSRSSSSSSSSSSDVENHDNNNHSKETLSMEEFCSEIHRLSHDLRQPSFLPERLQQLFFNIVRKEDPSSRMDRAQLDHAIKKYLIKEQQYRSINTTATELQLMSIYMKKKKISLQSILEVTESGWKNEKIHLSQLSSLISSLLIMYEVYVSEFGIPLEERSTQPSDEVLVIDPLSRPISELTSPSPSSSSSPSTMQTDRSTTGEEEDFQESTNIDQESGETSSSQISKMVSFKVQMPSEIASTVGNVLATLRKSLSFKTKNAPILPEEIEPEKKLTEEPLRSSIPRNSTSLPIEINHDFVKHLDWEEKTKLLLLVRSLREGDSSHSHQPQLTKKNEKDDVNIILNTDDGYDNDKDDDLLLNDGIPEPPIDPKAENKVNPLTSPRRSFINTSVNRVENLKNDVLKSFNQRIGQASLLMKHNR